jgi:flagellar biosynthesis/type III secretory pathway protein FliH
MQSWIYKEGLEKGEEKGLEKGRLEGEQQTLVRLFERRLARALTPEERTTLAARLREQGAERLTDTALDLSPEDLAAWLAPTNGH